MVSCTKGFEELNKPYKDADVTTLNIPGLFNRLAETATDEDNSLYVSLFYHITNQQGVQNTTAPYLNYSSSLWDNYYPFLIAYKSLIKKIDEDPLKETFNNVRYMAMILLASRTLHMLDYYGDFPYSDAANAELGIAHYRPKYDKEADIYKAVLADLETAVNGIKTGDPTQISIGKSESFLDHDFAAWIRFANALRLRYAVRLYDKEQAFSSKIIADIIGGNKPLPANQQPGDMQKNNFGYWPGKVNPPIKTDRLWYTFREKSISNMRMSSNVWNQMSSNMDLDGSGIFDPRCKIYFQPNNAGQWSPQAQAGGEQDGGDPYAGDGIEKPKGTDPQNRKSAFNLMLVRDQNDFPYLILTEADVYFLKAEIYQRGMGVAKDIGAAKNAYEAGIKSSVDFWDDYAKRSFSWTAKPAVTTTAQMDAFLNNPKVAYNGANDMDALTKIATQAWLATLFEPAEAWAIVRRTGLTPKDPAYTPPVINRLPYPNEEKVQNFDNWKAALDGAILDPMEQVGRKLYWMR
jgi:hypothetical protein